MSPTRRPARLSNFGEFQLIQSIPRQFSTQGFHPTVGTGDDAAVLPPSPLQQVVLSTDLLVEDIHFTRKAATFYDIGYKAAAANLSDIAAMGGTPTAILVAIALKIGKNSIEGLLRLVNAIRFNFLEAIRPLLPHHYLSPSRLSVR